MIFKIYLMNYKSLVKKCVWDSMQLIKILGKCGCVSKMCNVSNKCYVALLITLNDDEAIFNFKKFIEGWYLEGQLLRIACKYKYCVSRW